MKIVYLLSLIFLTLFAVFPVYAQTPNSATSPTQTVQPSNEFTVQNEPSSVITLLKNFVEGFDSFLGGFIFYTPNPLADRITLKDNSEIPGVAKYRNIFYEIAIPTLAIIIAGIAITKLGTDNTHELKSFALRFFLVLALFLTAPSVLSYSIQFNNLLVDKISTTQKFTGFLENYFDRSQEQLNQEQVSNNQASEKFGIPSFDISLTSGVLKSFGKFIVQLFLFALTFIFLLCGFIYLGFQFVIRFATLLFLGVIYPIVLPFALAERTQSVVIMFFKIWFTFLIQQPAFVLGFAIATDIFNSILNANGPSVGMLFFYTGFLFFLGGVNMLVARIFGDIWVAASGNIAASIATRAVTSPISGSLSDFKKGFFGGSISNALGRQTRSLFKSKKDSEDPNGNGSSLSGAVNPNPKGSPGNTNGNVNQTLIPKVPPFSQKLSGKGLALESINQKQGVVSVSGQAYKYEDKNSNLTSYTNLP